MNNLGGSSNTNAGAAGQKEDYVDKALDMGEKKFGVKSDRSVNEKVTDTARNMFEKATGKNVPDKVSN
ncbi:hypothetical protein BLS_000485 [Venturia inaequalis]|uniref:Uncharacterized protein n=1 Tax=Venturia inaequalis TaxID=5025 RepID=A0A8H3VHJ6_VENIN|nr:hypothetical protein BLS_000485 [Venturia inaequalis]KAE9988925.1 hypothetical protein EG328_005635 [Venturia inaequalis]KAE9992558.1 hypothetical protein EG327_008572 [Venturia inaequalis]RDI78588.1 hypothetical protein Vi05172_g11518 [Venturia inaequalis]